MTCFFVICRWSVMTVIRRCYRYLPHIITTQFSITWLLTLWPRLLSSTVHTQSNNTTHDTLPKADHRRMRVFPVTWQRWRPHNSTRHCRKPHAAGNVTVPSLTGVIADWSFTLQDQEVSRFLPLWPSPSPDDLHIRTWSVFSEDIPADRKRLSTSRLAKVIVLDTYIQYNRKHYHAALWAVNKYFCAILFSRTPICSMFGTAALCGALLRSAV